MTPKLPAGGPSVLLVAAAALLLLLGLAGTRELQSQHPLPSPPTSTEGGDGTAPTPRVGPTPAGDTPTPEIQQLRSDLMGILTSTGNREGQWGVLAVSLDRGDTILALNPRKPLVPASNMKLLTTAAALELLGPDFRYRTFLLGDGPQVGEVLQGDLIFYGTGDPSLSERFYDGLTAPLDSLATALQRAGIREIQGDLVVDGSFYAGPELHPDWDPRDFNDAFAAPVAAVIFNENDLTLRVEASTRVGSPPTIHTLPTTTGLEVLNRARTVSRGGASRIWLFRDTPWDPIGIEGQIPAGGGDVWRRLPVPDPLRFAGIQLAEALRGRGIQLRGRVVTVREPGRSRVGGPAPTWSEARPGPTILATLESPPLLDLIRVVNKESHNLFAETVARTLGRTLLGEGSFSGGQAAIRSFLLEQVGIPASGLEGRDGSGLSARNHVSPGVLVQLLAYMTESPNWEAFQATLPVAGTRREMGRMYRSPAAGNLRAKTGTMEGVSALSGVVTTRTGERILFSILSNQVASEYRAKRAEDQLGIRLASLSRPLPN